MVSISDIRNLVPPDKKIIVYVPEEWGEMFPKNWFPIKYYHCIEWFKDFESFEKTIETHAFDLVLMCIWKNIGESFIYNGKFVKKIREKLPKAKIIAISAVPNLKYVEDSILSGADWLLRIPFNADGFFNALRDYEWQEPYVHKRFKLARYFQEIREKSSKE